jgi:hypothetical protein
VFFDLSHDGVERGMRLAGHAFGSVRGLAPAGDSVAGRYFALTTLTPSCMNPLQPASRDSVANALDRWDEEGGAPVVLWPLPYEPSDLLDVERRVLECLGAALSQRMQ